MKNFDSDEIAKKITNHYFHVCMMNLRDNF